MDHLTSLDNDDRLDIFEAWSLLAGMTAATTRGPHRPLGHRQHPYRHHRGLPAKAAVTVDHLPTGRLEFGISAPAGRRTSTRCSASPSARPPPAPPGLDEALPIIRTLAERCFRPDASVESKESTAAIGPWETAGRPMSTTSWVRPCCGPAPAHGHSGEDSGR